ncbi:TPA: hypothetical protein ACH3X3_008540 [Trebouxia sp. C0006]
MTLVAGCYERFIFGFDLPIDTSKAQDLAKRFAYPGHQGAVKCLTAGGTFVVSGGADDQLHIYDTQSQKDLGFLMNPGEGAISAVALYVPPGASAPTHLFSGGVDGTMAVWSAGRSWDCLKNYVKFNSWESYVSSGGSAIILFDGHGCSGKTSGKVPADQGVIQGTLSNSVDSFMLYA